MAVATPIDKTQGFVSQRRKSDCPRSVSPPATRSADCLAPGGAVSGAHNRKDCIPWPVTTWYMPPWRPRIENSPCGSVVAVAMTCCRWQTLTLDPACGRPCASTTCPENTPPGAKATSETTAAGGTSSRSSVAGSSAAGRSFVEGPPAETSVGGAKSPKAAMPTAARCRIRAFIAIVLMCLVGRTLRSLLARRATSGNGRPLRACGIGAHRNEGRMVAKPSGERKVNPFRSLAASAVRSRRGAGVERLEN